MPLKKRKGGAASGGLSSSGQSGGNGSSSFDLRRLFVMFAVPPLLLISVLLLLYFYRDFSSNFQVMAPSSVFFSTVKIVRVNCSESGSSNGEGVSSGRETEEEESLLLMEGTEEEEGCYPSSCFRAVSDSVVTGEEAGNLLGLAKKGFAITGGGSGSASILDLHSGALSAGEQFVDFYKLIQEKVGGDKTVFKKEEFDLYTNIKDRIKEKIAQSVGISPSDLYLTYPSFFSRLTSQPSKNIHDEFWHIHVDKETYPSFVYTSLLYLSTYKYDFEGGRFVFVDSMVNRTIEPRTGRVSFFTSGSENPHFVERVSKGIRFAITISFTCDKANAIEDPSYERLYGNTGGKTGSHQP